MSLPSSNQGGKQIFLPVFFAILAAAAVIGALYSCNEDRARQAREGREMEEVTRRAKITNDVNERLGLSKRAPEKVVDDREVSEAERAEAERRVREIPSYTPKPPPQAGK